MSSYDSTTTEPSLHSTHQDEEEDELAEFRAVLKCATLEELPAHAVSLRKNLTPSVDHNGLTCIVELTDPHHGSYNIVIPLKFSDGKQWLIRIPHNGTPEAFEEAASQNLVAEIRMMQMLKRETNIPVPEIYDFEVSLGDGNKFRVPYIIMEWVHGKSLDDVWADFSIGREERMKRNCTTLNELSHAILQLNKYTFAQGGSPLYEAFTGHLLSDVGAAFQENQSAGSWMKNDGEPQRVYHSLGPYNTWDSFLFDDYKPWLKADEYDIEGSKLRIAKLFSSWIPQRHPHGQPFVLAHPDLDTHNIIVDDEGHLLSIIDWDHVRTVPHYLGNESYPKWLTFDLDYSSPREHIVEGNKTTEGRELSAAEMHEKPVLSFEGALGWWVLADSPEDLRAYRAVWDESMLQQGGEDALSLAQDSLFLQNLYLAVSEPMCFLNRFDHLQQLIQKRMIARGLISKERIYVSKADQNCAITEILQDEETEDSPDGASVSGDRVGLTSDNKKGPTPRADVQANFAMRSWSKVSSYVRGIYHATKQTSQNAWKALVCSTKTTMRKGSFDDYDSEDSADSVDDEDEPEDLNIFDLGFYEDAAREGILSKNDTELLKQGFRLFVS